MKSQLKDNNVEMYSLHNEGKSVIAEKHNRTFKDNICNYLTSFSESVCIDKLDDTVNEYNNTYHSLFKMEPANVKSSTYTDFDVGNNG